jgi:mannose-6-phosphate isomerase-like protein (cupin superfamily)
MKSFGIGLISSLLFSLVMSSKVEAFVFPNVTPDPDAPSYLFLEGGPITFLKRGETTSGRYTLAETLVAPGTGVLPHIHHHEDEWFYIEEGNLQIVLGDNTYPDTNQVPGINAPKDILHVINATPGTLVYGEKYHIHGLTNVGTIPAKVLLVWVPSGFENLIEEVSQPVQDPSNPPPFNPEILSLFASAAPNYGLVNSSSFEQFGDIEANNNFPNHDNHADKLLALLAEDTKSVPEPSSLGGVLAFGTLGTISILRRKHKSASKVR